MESHKRILFRHVCPHQFVVYTTFEVFVPGLFTRKSLETVQTELLLVSIATIASHKLSTQILDGDVVPLLIISYQEEIGSSPSVIELGLSENVELLLPSSCCQDIHKNVVLLKNANLTEGEGKF